MTLLFTQAPLLFIDAVQQSGIQYVARQIHLAAWEQALLKTHYITVNYSNALIDFYLAYQNGQDLECVDISFILEYENQPCAVWPLSLSLSNNRLIIASHGLPILPPLFVQGVSAKLQKKLVKKCQHLLIEFCQTADISTWQSAELFSGFSEQGLSQWHLQAMALGLEVRLAYDMFIDLSCDLAQIKSAFRKSYKSLIHSGLRLWDVSVMAQEDTDIWDEFHALHVEVAGQETRCAASWQVQHQAIIEGNAFLVILRDEQGTMVGGGFFSTTRDEASYGVGVYQRALFDKPLGHVVQYRAIEEMQRRGLRWYKVGEMAYPVADYTAKEQSIAYFKQGFASHVFPKYRLFYTA